MIDNEEFSVSYRIVSAFFMLEALHVEGWAGDGFDLEVSGLVDIWKDIRVRIRMTCILLFVDFVIVNYLSSLESCTAKQ